jgi:hypothetical protein
VFDDYDIEKKKLHLKTETMRNFFITNSKPSFTKLTDCDNEIKKLHEEIDVLKLSVWKLENPPKFKFNDKVLFKPHRFKETIKETLIIKGESSIGKTDFYYSIRQNDFERFYYVEISNRIIIISENNLVKLTD